MARSQINNLDDGKRSLVLAKKSNFRMLDRPISVATTFSENSYGFRPERSAQLAAESIASADAPCNRCADDAVDQRHEQTETSQREAGWLWSRHRVPTDKSYRRIHHCEERRVASGEIERDNTTLRRTVRVNGLPNSTLL